MKDKVNSTQPTQAKSKNSIDSIRKIIEEKKHQNNDANKQKQSKKDYFNTRKQKNNSTDSLQLNN